LGSKPLAATDATTSFFHSLYLEASCGIIQQGTFALTLPFIATEPCAKPVELNTAIEKLLSKPEPAIEPLAENSQDGVNIAFQHTENAIIARTRHMITASR
jgi:hypothetical protein